MINMQQVGVWIEMFKRAWKQNKEYPANIISGTFAEIVATLTYLLFYVILQDLGSEILNWNYYDFVVLYLMASFSSLLLRFFWLRSLRKNLISGDLNILLTKPFNPKSYIFLKSLTGSVIFYTGVYGLATLIFVSINGTYSNHHIALLSFILGFIVQVLFLNVLFSTVFFIKENSFLFNIYYRNIHLVVEMYTPKFFEKSFLFNIVYLFPATFINYFFVEALKGRTESFFIFLPYFIAFGTICLVTLKIQWHYGLKKYEAFG